MRAQAQKEGPDAWKSYVFRKVSVEVARLKPFAEGMYAVVDDAVLSLSGGKP
jgi:hypothetical protein